jgi:hypothetical protein
LAETHCGRSVRTLATSCEVPRASDSASPYSKDHRFPAGKRYCSRSYSGSFRGTGRQLPVPATFCGLRIELNAATIGGALLWFPSLMRVKERGDEP